MNGKATFVAAALLLTAAAPAFADLHFTIHTEARPVSTSEPVSPLLAMAGDMAIKALFPDGSSESTYWISDNGSTRVELTKANAMMPAGSVMLHLASGSTVIINPADKTYWTLSVPASPLQAMAFASQLKPEVSVVRTGQFDTIAGLRAEHLTSTITLNLPASAGPSMGLPSSMTMDADVWVIDQYAAYKALAIASLPIASLFSLDALVNQGFVMKNVVRGSMLAGYELESVVTEIKEEPAAADAFQIPGDYKEVPSPSFGLPMGAGRD